MTTKAKHTLEPWEVEIVTDGSNKLNEVYARISGIAFSEGIKIGTYKKKLPEEAKANAERIVACVNACEGINPEAVPEMMEALENIYHLIGDKARKEQDPITVVVKIDGMVDQVLAKAKGE